VFYFRVWLKLIACTAQLIDEKSINGIAALKGNDTYTSTARWYD